MSEVVIERNASIGFGLLLLPAAGYCFQFAIRESQFELPAVYFFCLLLCIATMAFNFYQDIRFVGLGMTPPRLIIVLPVWALFGAIVFLYFIGQRYEAVDLSRKARAAHLLVGLYLYVFAASSIFGSYFSGLGVHLFLRSPFTWIKYLMMKRRGEL